MQQQPIFLCSQLSHYPFLLQDVFSFPQNLLYLTFLIILDRFCCIQCDYLDFSKLKLIKLLLQMGQSESADNEDDNCFRACVKQKKEKSKKMQALPYHPQHKDSRFDRKSPETKMQHHDYNQPASSPAVHNSNLNTFETSLDYRLFCQQAKLKKKISLQKSANLVTNVPKDGCTLQNSLDRSREVVLGLQSKFSSSKHAFSFTTAKIISQKGKAESNRAGTRCSSHEKESGSQSQITNKTNQTSATSKSRKMLINKIEEIKQKYYERELEIEICNDEREYQEQVEKIDHIGKTIVENSQLPEQSIGEIKVIRNKILEKLREKKLRKVMQKETNDEPSMHLTVNQSLTVQDQLEIYSREGKVLFQETLMQSQALKKSKRMKNTLTSSGKYEVNRSINASRPDRSMEQKMQFSDYSEESLHQIRQLDEQYEDYRSKVTGISNFKSNHHGLKPQTQNQSGIPKSGIASRNSVNNPAHSDLQHPSSNPKKQKIPEQNTHSSSNRKNPSPTSPQL